MRTIPVAELKKILKNAPLETAVQLCLDKRVYNLKTRNGDHTACVLSDKIMPFSPQFNEADSRLSWSCDCSATDPCLHVWALVSRLYMDDKLYHAALRSAVGSIVKPHSSTRSAKARGEGDSLDLFDEGLYQPSLFDDEKPPSSTRPSINFEATHEPIPQRPEHHSARIDTAHNPRTHGGAFLVRFANLNQPELLVESLGTSVAARHETGLLGAMDLDPGTAAIQSLSARLKAESDHTLHLSEALDELVQLQDSPTGHSDRERAICFATPGRRLRLVALDALRIEPVFARKSSDGHGLYHLKIDFFADSNQRHASVPPSALACEGDVVYTLLRDSDTLLYRKNDAALTQLCRKLKTLHDPARAYDIEQLRVWIAERGIANASIALIGDEHFEYRQANPRALVTVQGGLGRTELFLRFAYDGHECGLHEDRAELTQVLDERTTLVWPRQRERETALLATLKELLVEMTQYERGLYADMVNDREVADISVVCELAEFVASKGTALMAAGFSLRMEGKPVRGGSGTLSFRAESGMDWFGFRSGWKPDADGTQASDIASANDGDSAGTPLPGNDLAYPTRSLGMHIDDHLERLGMAEVQDADGSTSWIILGTRDIDRLKLLRKLGMNADGMLETSPVNVTLIDSLYGEIENKDEDHVLRARAMSKNLAEFTARQIAHSHRDAAGTSVGGPDGAGNGSTTSNDADAIAHDATLPDLLPQPRGLQTTLRPYQLLGYNWLAYLHEQKLGGCLADDMGLGKTVQTIALLQHLKERNDLGPVVLVAPVVTLPNWEDEIQRFAPGLSCARHAGNDRARTAEALVGRPPAGSGDTPETVPPSVIAPRPDIILVSYHTLRNDLDLFVQVPWDYVILDEAHYIKNAGSQIFKAIRVLPATHRLSLTGTPIENSTMELWSQFSFLNPGLLGGKRRFMSDVASPIERGSDEGAVGTLRDTIMPFILRRRKQDVLDDLPPKDEILHWCEMAPDQARLYEEHRQLYRDQLAGILNDKGVERSRMDVFRFLLRLRQIAINPAMIQRLPDSTGLSNADSSPRASIDSPYTHISSCKMESLRMIVDESLQEDHKMLVFSQFVRALTLISRDLDRSGLRHALLTGATIDRRSVVNDFQNDPDLRLFLLSLKAGGVGINLTSADYVVLFDPWWNPAAERQAVDRAHRIGQKRPVTVYKFITRNTIEEKILALQHKKQRLVGSLLGGGDENLMSGMSENDVMNLFE